MRIETASQYTAIIGFVLLCCIFGMKVDPQITMGDIFTGASTIALACLAIGRWRKIQSINDGIKTQAQLILDEFCGELKKIQDAVATEKNSIGTTPHFRTLSNLIHRLDIILDEEHSKLNNLVLKLKKVITENPNLGENQVDATNQIHQLTIEVDITRKKIWGISDCE